jgi:CubicO group peptidase (beta-lactamase class C family)
MTGFADVDALAAGYHERGGQPGMAYGIVIGGKLVHAAGLGERHVGGPAPDDGTVFRIASMTKSFTASAVLALRDDGALRLDDAAEAYVPELRRWPPAAPDAPRVSIRHLLTMTAGLPTDDPWGDRQQGLPLGEFAAFLAGGVGFNWAPGTRFEYSNLGYAILGLVITAVTGITYQDYIRDRLLRPLGMTRTGFEAAEFAEADLARGYRRGQGGYGGAESPPVTGGSRGVVPPDQQQWSEVPPDPCGAFAPMGGVFSCVRDLTRWVVGFAAAFPAGEPEAGGAHPVRRATRREMQLPQVLTGWDAADGFPGAVAPALSAYGFGLFVEEHPIFGRIVSHSGGYPGFGSNMRWHPASGTGVIALGNSTYSAMQPLAARLLDLVLRRADPAAHGYLVPLAPAAGPWPATRVAQQEVSELLQAWDDDRAARLFTPNVAQDAPFAERRHAIALIRARIGEFRDDATRRAEFDTPAHCRWWLAGQRGVVQVQIQLSPELPPRVQSLTLAVPPAAGSPLAGTLDAILAWLNGTDRSWPPSIPAGGTVDTHLLARRLRMASTWAGPCRLGACLAGDGTATVTAELLGEYATLTLAVLVDPDSGLLRQADIGPRS